MRKTGARPSHDHLAVALAARNARAGITDVPSRAELRRLEALAQEWNWSPETMAMVARAWARIIAAKAAVAAMLVGLAGGLAARHSLRPGDNDESAPVEPLDTRLPVFASAP